MAAEMIARGVGRGGSSEWDVMRRMMIGGDFMIVDSSGAVVMDEPWSTSGNPKWNSTNPGFTAIAIVSKRHDVGRVSWVQQFTRAALQTQKLSHGNAAPWVSKTLTLR